MFTLISFLIALLTTAIIVGIGIYFPKRAARYWGRYTAVLVFMFLWFDSIIGSMGALAFTVIAFIPLFISIFVHKYPTK